MRKADIYLKMRDRQVRSSIPVEGDLPEIFEQIEYEVNKYSGYTLESIYFSEEESV